ncbi:MAG: DUF790 family protein [Archaeoglobus sp.]|nr:DUF790 family protein [Archaeoglobus sp.]
MLPKEFLEVRKYKGKIFPKFLKAGDVEIAELVLDVYRSNLGKKLKFAKKELKQLENSKNYKKMRGLARIIENNVRFANSTSLPPPQVRKFLFSRGFVTTKDERRKIIKEAAEKFGCSLEEIENSIFADLEEEAIIDEIGIENAEDLLRKYNLSLLQTTIFNSLRMTFWTKSEHKKILWAVKKLGLMYELGDNGGITLTGPAYVLKQTRRYGTSFAKLIPIIVSSPEWWIKAEILDEYSNKVYKLEISSGDALLPLIEPKMEFDSSLEEELYFRLKASKPEIEISREPEVIRAGDFAFIPDFKLKKGEKEVYIEIAGFWTEEYLKKKVEKIKKLNVPLIVIGREEISFVSEFFIPIEKKLPFIKILKLVNSYFGETGGTKDLTPEMDLAETLKRVQGAEVANIANLARKCGIEVGELKRRIAESLGASKIVIENWMFDRKYVEEVREKLEKGLNENLDDLESLLKKDGINVLLDFLGYKIVWEGITAARVVKKF